MSATGRAGYAWDRWMLYVKGGVAWLGDRYDVTGTFTGVPFDLRRLGDQRLGWTAGGGVEWAFSDDWSVTLEYDYYGFGHAQRDVVDQVNAVSGTGEFQAERSDRQARGESPHLRSWSVRKRWTSAILETTPRRSDADENHEGDRPQLGLLSPRQSGDHVRGTGSRGGHDAGTVSRRKFRPSSPIAKSATACRRKAFLDITRYRGSPDSRSTTSKNQLQALSSTSGRTISCSMSGMS